jgi:hypothetical protein
MSAPNFGQELAQESQKIFKMGGLLIETKILKQRIASHEPQQSPQQFRRQIGKNYYEVVVHFSNTSKENISDKISRLIRNEIANGTAVEQ